MSTESVMLEVAPGQAATFGRITRQTMMRAIVGGMLLVAGLVAMQTLQKALNLTFDKPPMPLSKPLPEMAKQLGTPARYVAEGVDENMTEEVVEVLGTNDYLLRAYTDLTKQGSDVGSTLKLNLNYYATGSATPHVPEVCWAGAGMIEADGISKKVFAVKGVRRRDGSTVDLRMRMISFLPSQGALGSLTGETGSSGKYLNVAYVFEVNGQYVATPREVVSQFWKASSPHAYHTKIEVTVPQYCTQEDAQAAISEFMRAAIPAVEECLPVPETGNAPATQTASGEVAPGQH